MKYFELEVKGEIYKLRLTSNDCMIIEKKTGMSIIDYIQNMSITTIISLLRYMVGSNIPNFNDKDASKLYDELIDEGYTLKKIIDDVIMETLVVSGFLAKEEMEEMRATKK